MLEVLNTGTGQLPPISPNQITLRQPAGRLKLTVPYRKTETFQSFVSRLSRRNGCGSAPDFCRYMGISWSDVVRGNRRGIEQVNAILDDGFSQIGRYAVSATGHHKYRINGQALTSSTVRRYQLRVCPVCIQEDVISGGKNAAYGRAEWQLTPFRICPHHSTLMIKLPRSFRPRSPHDFAGRAADHLQEILAAAEMPTVMSHQTRFEAYLSTRLSGKPDQDWLDQLELHVVCKLVQKLGILLEFGSTTRPSKLSDSELSMAAETGLEALGSTKDHFLIALEQVVAMSHRSVRSFYKDLGVLSCWLSRVDQADPCYAPVLDCVSNFVFGQYPIATGQNVLGRECGRRKIHTLASASEAYCVDINRLKKFMNGLKSTDDLYDLEASFPADWHKEEITEFSECLSTTETAAFLGLSYDAFRRLGRFGYLKARFDSPGLTRCYHPSDIEAFVSLLFNRATELKEIPSGFQTLPWLCVTTRSPIEELVTLASSGALPSLCHVTRDQGLKGLFADPNEVWDRLSIEPANGFSKAELKVLLRVNDSTVRYLVDRGFLNATTIHRTHRKRPIGIVSGQSLKEFLKDYVTLGLIASDEDTQVQQVLANLRKRQIDPLSFPAHLSKVFRRADLSAVEYQTKKPSEYFAQLVTRLHSDLRNPDSFYPATSPSLQEAI